ncbi:MAG: hypothetical protein A3H57_01650 [Candidatus Taylorbacteria bacterium RIFCSPLOWO2_02_FULL_43_11]|uniref:D-glycerate dehydrogenase n=1 Tax=Candidatus Taylorbacteria bacterium RIFCSPHIGHO2_02_FULL_46_13 TaxID=1802312 RepID=A0A1G2MRR3_9BACT|nr:MAG: hypothetical protein A3C06_03190 [Candidatus Taylorbacteria bacterium RIFCSPHIGHO2_02_FULL_46_13]OHA36766.1 MAG: hypothetical protein A3H57_01650 [Candidatus Taylorbacteria bacterium RIFCSPLOWO2_02_FULL_43_11]
MKKIYVTRSIPAPAVEMLEAKGYAVTVSPHERALTKAELLKALGGQAYDGVLTLLHDEINAEVFDAAPSVKIYSNYAVGFNNIDTSEAVRRGVTVTNTPSDAVNESVAEHTFALLLACMHRIVEGDTFMRAGTYKGWDPNLLIGTDLKGKTLGAIGAGRIGALVIEKAVRGFGMKVVYFDVVRNERVEKEYGAEYLSSVEEVLKVADAVTLHVLLTKETQHLMNAARFALMKKSAYLINTCRGPVVDETALADALSKGIIRGAAIDVYEHEPSVAKGLLKLPNIIFTPHIASATDAARADMSTIAAQNLIDFFEGRIPAHVAQ